jgi:hypothetical protein
MTRLVFMNLLGCGEIALRPVAVPRRIARPQKPLLTGYRGAQRFPD